MDLNVRHVFNLTQLLLPLLNNVASKQYPARVIMISSVEGQRAMGTKSPMATYSYTASKVAVIHLTKALSRTLVEHDMRITVNCVCPGVFPSNMSKEILAAKDLFEPTPSGRYGRTADIASTCLYLAGVGGGFTNGAVITVDGGLYLHH